MRLLDKDNNGYVSLSELGVILHRLGRKASDIELAEASKNMALYHSGYGFDPDLIYLTPKEFTVLICGSATKAQRQLHKQLRNFRDAFTLFDKDGEGTVDIPEFIEVMQMLNLTLTLTLNPNWRSCRCLAILISQRILSYGLWLNTTLVGAVT